MDMLEYSTRNLIELKQKAQLFTKDNFKDPGPWEYLLIENAFLSGAAAQTAFETMVEAQEKKK